MWKKRSKYFSILNYNLFFQILFFCVSSAPSALEAAREKKTALESDLNKFHTLIGNLERHIDTLRRKQVDYHSELQEMIGELEVQ